MIVESIFLTTTTRNGYDSVNFHWINGGRQSTADSLLNINEHSVKGMPAYPIIIARGKGEFLWDADGKQYIDFNVGFSACNQGHCHPKIVSVMMAQCRTLTMPSRSVSNAQYQQFSRKLSQVTGFDKMMECNGGAEALDAAIKVARAWGRRVKGIEKDKAIAFTMSNVGPQYASISVRFRAIEDLECTSIARGHAGYLAPSDAYLVRVRELCDRYNILLISDEVQAGLGRTGHLLSYQSAGIKLDVVVLGKSLSGGTYPISAVLGRKEVMTSLEAGQEAKPRESQHYGSTFSGNPLASAIGLASLSLILDEPLPARAASLGAKFEARFRTFKSPCLDTITGKGLFRGIYLHEIHLLGHATVCPALIIDEVVMFQGIDILEQALNELPDIDAS
ncbi:PLP-dependent transferase [Amniculicola lignicola CBS 123094]|uniref:Ornithine aminotransferase n=1 Tax=Amniculicola lignicola CBS 123094 TaxID=1392246 RepID=A0A6A5WBD5_9PLEO|nr:PLP-dependent transferase [Amniculicola lignicola CBS 123094]